MVFQISAVQKNKKVLWGMLFLGALGQVVSFRSDARAAAVLTPAHAAGNTLLEVDDSFLPALTERNNPLSFLDVNGVVLRDQESLQLKLVAQVASPQFGGEVLRASGAFALSNTVLVSYNREGEKTLGGLVTIDVSTPSRPRVTSGLGFLNADINSVSARDGQVYFTGARGPVPENPAFVARVDLDQSRKLTPKIAQFATVPSYAGTDVYASNAAVYVTSGNVGGGLSVFARNDFSLRSWIPLADARSVSPLFFSTLVGVLSGTPGLLTLLNPGGRRLYSVPLGGAQTPESKSVLNVSGDLAVAALNEGGVKLLCARDLRTLAALPQVVVPPLPPAKTVTNAATIQRGVLYTANGEGGVQAYKVERGLSYATQCGRARLIPLGRIDLGNGFSANDIVGTRNHLFVADGLGGLKVIALSNTNPQNSLGQGR